MWLEAVPQQEQRVHPALLSFVHLLQLSSEQLYQTIEAEVEANPALEVEELERCPLCGSRLERGVCYPCLGRQGPPPGGTWPAREGEDAPDPLAGLPHQAGRAEYLLGEVAPAILGRDRFIAEYLIGSLDGHGLLTEQPVLVAAALGVEVGRVLGVLEALRSVGPPGLAASDIRSSLLEQLRRLELEGGAVPPLVREIVERHLEDLGGGAYRRIARRLGAGQTEVLAARDFIRRRLSPFPVFLADDASQEARSPWIIPDVIYRLAPRRPATLLVEVVESRQYRLRLSPAYRRAVLVLREGEEGFSADEAQHVREHVGRAQRFLAHLRQRRRALERVARAVAEAQHDYLIGQQAHPLPLTRSQVAGRLGLHESTVSRAAAAKHVLLPNRRLVPFGHLFTPSAGPKGVLEEIVASEGRPLSDAELARELARRGHRVSRRAVAKYRSQLGIPSSRLR